MQDKSWQSFFRYEDEFINGIWEKLNSIKERDQVNYKDFNVFDIIHPGCHEGIDKFFEDYKIPEGSEILEIGSGMGATSRHLFYTKQMKSFGIDFMERLVDISMEINKTLGIQDQIIHVQGDACNFQHNPNGYDLAFAIGVFVHIDNDEGILNTIRAIKPGGLLYIEDYYLLKDPDTYDDNDRTIIESRGIIGTKKQSDMRELLTGAGLEIVEMSEFGHEWSEKSWDRANELAKAVKDGSFQPSEKHFHEFVTISPELTAQLRHLSLEQIRERWPALCEYVDPEEIVFNKTPITGIYRIVARKLQSA